MKGSYLNMTGSAKNVGSCSRGLRYTCASDAKSILSAKHASPYCRSSIPKYLGDHTFHRIPSQDFPGSISTFIRRFEFECPFATTRQITRRKSMILEMEPTGGARRCYHSLRGSTCDLALLDSRIAEMLLARWSSTDR